jgi:hypothetical protein
MIMVSVEKGSAKAPLPFHLLTLTALPLLQFTSGNASRIAPLEALGVYATLLLPCVAAALLLRFLFRRADITDLLVGLVFGMVFLPVTFLTMESNKLAWVAIWLLMILAVFRYPWARNLFPGLLTIATGVLCAFHLYTTLASGVWFQRATWAEVAEQAFPEVPPPGTAPTEKPDIYYFIFDRYARADFMKSVYHHDNDPFIAELRKRGFYVADQAYANYQRTAHSVVSSLNFDYLDKLSTEATKNSGDWRLIYSMFQDFRIARFLKTQGYEVHYSGTWWEPTRRLAVADVHHNHFEVRELLRVIYEASLVTHASRAVGFRWGDPLYWQCQRSRLMFEDLQSAAASDKPRFHFAHFLIPHPPFVTHESGRCMDLAEAKSRDRATNYGGQVTYANGQILKTVDALMARPGPKPIIILQADEGPWPQPYAGDEVTSFARDVSSVDWVTVPPDMLREKFGILSAVYAPRLPTEDLTPEMTPVNTFRKVLRAYFNVPIENVPDRMKIYLDNGHLYEFKDVTDMIRGP